MLELNGVEGDMPIKLEFHEYVDGSGNFNRIIGLTQGPQPRIEVGENEQIPLTEERQKQIAQLFGLK